MRKLFVLQTMAALLALACGCSFLVSFDPDGKPCGGDGGCLEGYVCDHSGMCVHPTPPDAGGGASDGGIASDGGK